MADINESLRGGEGGVEPRSFKVKLETKICEKYTSLVGAVKTMLSSRRNRGRKVEKIKLC